MVRFSHKEKKCAEVYILIQLFPATMWMSAPYCAFIVDRTRQWWDEERHLYDLYTSEFTLAELAEGDFPRKEQAIQLVRDLPRLAPMEEIEEIVEMYVAHYLVPSSDIRDGFHLAFACFYKMDYLLTWNCAHLANIRKQEHFRVINLRSVSSTLDWDCIPRPS